MSRFGVITRNGIVRSFIEGSQADLYDPDAQAFFTAASITDNTQKSAVNTLVLSLKSANIWTKMKALYPVVGGIASSHAVNLKTPGTYNLSFATGWNHASTGMTPNGATYADTNLIPSNVFNNTTYNHLSYYSRTNNNNVDFLMGCRNSYETALLLSGRDSFWAYYCDNSNSTYRNTYNSTLRNTAAMSIGTQQGTNIKVFRNNILISQNTELKFALSTFGNRNIIIGAWDDMGTITNFTNKECSFISIGTSLTDAEASSLYTAVQTFQTTLGRQV